MKRVLIPVLVLVLVVGFASRASATLLAYEPFTNVVGTAIIGSSDGYGFVNAWQANSSQGTATNLGYSLSYFDGVNYLLTDALGNTTPSGLSGSGFFQGSTTASSAMQPTRYFNFARGTNTALPNNTDLTTTWISFLSIRQGPTGTIVGNPYGRGVNWTLDLTNMTGGAVLQKSAVGNSSANTVNTIGLLSAGGSIRPGTNTFGAPISAPITNFIVFAIQHTPTNDNQYLWVNPTTAAGLALGGADPAFNTAETNVIGLFDYSFDRTRIFVGGNCTGTAQPYGEEIFDEFRVGDTWADVTPVFVPEPATACLMGLGSLGLVMWWRRTKS